MTRAEAFERFKDAVRHVWRNADFVLPHVELADDPPKGGVLAALSYAGEPRAIGDAIARRATTSYRLLLADALLERPAEDVWRVLVHEAAHVGHRGHGAAFRELVTRKGGVVAGAGLDTGGRILAERKVGHRYRVEREFPQEEEQAAVAWAKEQARAARIAGAPERWRITWG